MEQHVLSYDQHSRHLTVEKAITRTDQTIENIMTQIVEIVQLNPGITTGDLKKKLGKSTEYREKAYKYVVDAGKIVAKQVGNTSTKQHYDPSHPFAIDAKLA